MSEDELATLMKRYQDGELAAFDQLYQVLASPLRRFLVSLARQQASPDDLLQETFLQMHRARHTYLPPRPVLPWALAIARNVHRMERRSRSRHRRLEVEEPDALAEVPAPGERGQMADCLAVRDALEKLPADRRKPLVMHHVWGFSFGEIGELLGLAGGAAKVRAHRGMSALRAVLASSQGGTAADNPPSPDSRISGKGDALPDGAGSTPL